MERRSDLTAKRFFFTIDVDWTPGSEEGVQGLLDLCRELDLKATLFIAGRFVYEYPGIVREALRQGHELGTHGWEHDQNPGEDFRSASYHHQKEWLSLATRAFEDVLNQRPISFRAPNLWVSETMLRVLEDMEYRIDSSVPAKRFDMGFGRMNQLRYLRAPWEVYYPSYDHIAKRGNCSVLEVPPSAFLIPINMTSLRVLGYRMVSWAVHQIWRRSNILVFYCHPSEFVPSELKQLAPDEPARHREGTGPENFVVLKEFLNFAMSLGYEPRTICEAHL